MARFPCQTALPEGAALLQSMTSTGSNSSLSSARSCPTSSEPVVAAALRGLPGPTVASSAAMTLDEPETPPDLPTPSVPLHWPAHISPAAQLSAALTLSVTASDCQEGVPRAWVMSRPELDERHLSYHASHAADAALVRATAAGNASSELSFSASDDEPVVLGLDKRFVAAS